MVIREIVDSNEKRAIIECCDRSFERPLTTRDNYEELFSKVDKFAVFLAVYDEQKPVGYSAFYANDTQTKTGYISLITVVEEMQNKHVGSILMQKSIDRAVENGMTHIRLEVLKTNKSAIRFYEQWGFKYERDCSDDGILMIKQIA